MDFGVNNVLGYTLLSLLLYKKRCNRDDSQLAVSIGMEMGKAGFACVALLVLISCAGTRAAVIGHQACNGRMGRCHGVEEEWAMSSEIGRRLLQTTTSGFITYGALIPDRASPQAMQRGNAYTRGCQANVYCRFK